VDEIIWHEDQSDPKKVEKEFDLQDSGQDSKHHWLLAQCDFIVHC
jgi:hypothetical protein